MWIAPGTWPRTNSSRERTSRIVTREPDAISAARTSGFRAIQRLCSCSPGRALGWLPVSLWRAPRAWAPRRSALLDERAVLKLEDRLPQLLLRVHHDRPVPGDRLLERLSRDQQEPDSLIPGLHHHLVTSIEQHERPVADRFVDRVLVPAAEIGLHRTRVGSIAKLTRTLEDIRE